MKANRVFGDRLGVIPDRGSFQIPLAQKYIFARMQPDNALHSAPPKQTVDKVDHCFAEAVAAMQAVFDVDESRFKNHLIDSSVLNDYINGERVEFDDPWENHVPVDTDFNSAVSGRHYGPEMIEQLSGLLFNDESYLADDQFFIDKSKSVLNLSDLRELVTQVLIRKHVLAKSEPAQ